MKEKKILSSIFRYRRYTDTFRWIFPLCFCLVFLNITSETYAINYYVSTSGNDANSGTLSSPFKTITRGIVKLKGGDILFVRTGTYVESLNIQQSGTESLPITITAYPGDHPVLDGQGQYWGYLVYLGGNYIHISDFEVKNNNTNGTHTGGYGVYLGGHHNKVSNLNVHHIWENGILASGDYSIVEDCQIWQCAFSNSISPGSGGWSSGLSAARDKVDGITDNAILRRNTVYENWGEGLSAFEAIGTIIEDNRVYDNWSVNIYISDATHTLVQRNIIYRTKDMTGGSQVGILLGDERFTPPSSNNTIINNIVYGCRRNFMSGGMTNNVISNNTFMNSTNVACVQVYNEAMVNSSFVNNIIIQEDGLAITDGFAANVNFHVNHNLWSKTPVAGASGVGDIIGNAQIAKAGSLGSNLAAAYFKLLENSPAINKGIVVSNITQDYFGNSRDATPDIGACEYLIKSQEVSVTGITITGSDGQSSISTNGGTLQMSAVVSPSDATNKTITWSIKNGTGQAYISTAGLVTAISDGLSTVTATATDGSGVYGSFTVTISNQTIAITGISVTGAGGATNISTNGGTLQLSADLLPVDATNRTVTWSIQNGTGQASINSTGLVTAVANGTATAIATATDGSGISGSLVITISGQAVKVTGITVTGAEGATSITTNGGTLQLYATILPADATNKSVVWSVHNGSGQASISLSGQLTSIDDGIVTVIAEAGDASGVQGSLEVTIKNQINPEDLQNDEPFLVWFCKSELKIQMNTEIIYQYLRIFNIYGKLVFSSTLVKNESVYDLSNLLPGMYIISLSGEAGNIKTVKVCKP